MKRNTLAMALSLTMLMPALAGCGNSNRAEAAVVNNPTETVLNTNSGAEMALSVLEHRTDSGDAPVVYYLSGITPEAMVEIYNALAWTPTGKVAVKLSTGEPPASNYLRPELITDLVQLVDGIIAECNTAYGGSRASTAMHYQVAEDHGFTAIAPVQIQDENGSMTLPVNGGTVLSENYVGAAFMVTGPATKITNLGAVKIVLGVRKMIFDVDESIGALFHVPHGISNAMLLSTCLSYVMDGVRNQFAALGRAIDIATFEDDSDKAANNFQVIFPAKLKY